MISLQGQATPVLVCHGIYNKIKADNGATENPQLVLDAKQINLLISQYQKKLGFQQDPTKTTFSAKNIDRIFGEMLLRSRNGRMTSSSLAVINHILKRGEYNANQKTTTAPITAEQLSQLYNHKMIQWLVEDAKYWLEQKLDLSNKSELRILQGNLKALQYAMDQYLPKFIYHEHPVDRDGESTEEKKVKEKDKDKDKEKKEEKPEQDNGIDIPELPDKYKPHTKDTEQKGDQKQKKHRVADVNVMTAYFAQRYFSLVTRFGSENFQEMNVDWDLPQPSVFKNTNILQTIKTGGKKAFTLFLPPGHRPFQPSDPRVVIVRKKTGGYQLQNKDGLAEIKIPLEKEYNLEMPMHVRQVYTRKVGFDINEWPDLLRAAVINKYSAQDAVQDPMKVALAIAHHIAKDYLYSVDAKEATDPIEALKSGAFQCDMAAFTMVSLLRDVYNIPSRVVAGYRAKREIKGSKDQSYLVLPGEAHAWVEVFHNGEWHLFDPTPMKKDRKKDEGKEETDMTDQQLDNLPEVAMENEDNDQSSEVSSEKNKETKDHKTKMKEDTEKRVKEESDQKTKEGKSKDQGKPGDKTSEQTDGKNKDDQDNNESDKKNKDEGDSDQISKEELIKELELGSLEVDPKPEKNNLAERMFRLLLQYTLETTRNGADIQNSLNYVKQMANDSNSASLQELVRKAILAHDFNHPALTGWLDQLARGLKKEDLNKIYRSLIKARNSLEVYAQLLDSNGKIPRPDYLLSLINQIVTEMNHLSHAQAQDIALVRDLMKDQSLLVRRLVKEKYNLDQVGLNTQTSALAGKIKAGQLNDLRLMGVLAPMTEFILNSVPHPDMTEVKTWVRDMSKPRGRDLLPAQRFSDMYRAILGQPGKSYEQNMIEGTAHLRVHRQRILIPEGFGNEESERITIVLYDTSGSMSGDPERFQAGLISQFTATALSDVSPSGRNRHKLVIVPFDSTTGTPVLVNNATQALDVINNYRTKLKNTSGGTDIQKAMMQAFALIADAERRAGEPLAAANIVLMSDGGGSVDKSELLRARNAIDRQTPLQTMFIAINGNNPDLMNFAMDSKSMGLEEGFYREFSKELISEVLKDADTISLKEEDEFYTDKKSQDVPVKIYQLFQQATKESYNFDQRILQGSGFSRSIEYVHKFEGMKMNNGKVISRPIDLERWLIRIRQLAQNPIFMKDRKLLERVVDDLFINFEKLTGVRFQDLSDLEQGHLRHLARAAAGLND